MSGQRVAITGASGYLGVELARRCVDAGTEVLGLDIRNAPQRWPAGAAFALQDVTDPSLQKRLADFRPGVLVHLAWVFDPVHDLQREQRVDVDGTRNAFAAAAAAGARRIVYPSSTTSYGIDPQRTQPLTEEAPPTPNPAYPYGRFKAEVERWLPSFRAAHPEVELVVTRACIVLGPHARNIVTHVTEWPLMFRVAGANPPMQFLHEDDVAELLWWMIREAPPGTFNAAGAGVVSFKEICRMAGKPSIALPGPLLYALVALGWRLRLLRFPPGLLDYIRYTWVADTTHLTQELGFQPRYSTRDALADYFSARQRRRRD
ncbi:MAG: NAD-dependent epimerase/dehydratase family protein [Acidobacteriota bacterium]